MSKLTWIGHSQGTSQMFYAMSNNPTYWKGKLNLFVALAPVASLTHCSNTLMQTAAKYESEIRTASNALKLWSIATPGLDTKVVSAFCGKVPNFCNELQRFATTSDPNADDADRFSVYMGHFPAGTSLQSIYHYAQEMKATVNTIPLYNWGSSSANSDHYGQPTPPLVDVS